MSRASFMPLSLLSPMVMRQSTVLLSTGTISIPTLLNRRSDDRRL